jgi:hypothetical protein
MLSPEFIQKLPTNDQTILNKIIDEQSKVLPNRIPFACVQSKNKNRCKAKDDISESTIHIDKTTNDNTSLNNAQINCYTSPYKFGIPNQTLPGTPVKNNTTNSSSRTQDRSPITYGRGPRPQGRGGGTNTVYGRGIK